MERVLTLVCVLGTVALGGDEVGAAAVPHAHRHQRLQHLQEAVDRLLLRQRTDHILINNLQKAMKEAQQRDVRPSRPVMEEEKEEERRALTQLREAVKEVEGSVRLVLEQEQRRDDILEMRQELAALRSEVKGLKESREAERERSAAHSHSQHQREAVTAAWVVDNVRRLQDAVVDLQQAFNVSTAMHDKQEVESRLLVVSKDLGALRSSMAAVTSKAEAAVVTATALQEELTRTSQDSHHSSGRVAALEMEVSGIREEFHNLLVALPEGIVAGGHTQKTDTEIQVFGGMAAARTKAEQQLETQMEAVEAGLGEVQASSVKLLATLEALEARVEKEVIEVRQEVARLEYKATATQYSSKT